jgi:hypothetical protein
VLKKSILAADGHWWITIPEEMIALMFLIAETLMMATRAACHESVIKETFYVRIKSG